MTSSSSSCTITSIDELISLKDDQERNNVTSVVIDCDPAVSGEQVQLITTILPNLFKLGLPYCERIGKDRHALSSLVKLKHLKELDLSGTNLQGPDLQYIGGLTTLTSLNLAECDELGYDHGMTLAPLAALISLQTLNLKKTGIATDDLQYVALLPKLSVLNITCNWLVSPEDCVRHLAAMPSLDREGFCKSHPGLNLTEKSFEDVRKDAEELAELKRQIAEKDKHMADELAELKKQLTEMKK